MKYFGEIEIALLAGRAAELDQRQLDLLMAAIAPLLARLAAEDRGDVIGIAAHDVEQLALAGRLVIGDGGLDQVAGAIELVAVAQIGPALAGLDALEPGVDR